MIRFLSMLIIFLFAKMLFGQMQDSTFVELFEEEDCKTVEPPPVPPMPPPPLDDGIICVGFKDEMPLFANCNLIGQTYHEKKNCSDEKVMDFIYSHIKWPTGFCGEGIVVIQFIIEVDGSTSCHKIARDIGGGCGEEVLRVVKLMPDWMPGKQRGREVRVQYNLPVKFALN